MVARASRVLNRHRGSKNIGLPNPVLTVENSADSNPKHTTHSKGGFPVMAETTRNHIFSKEINQVIIAAMVLAPISIEKIVCE